MRIRTLALLTSFAAFACGGDDDGETTNNTTTGPTTTVTTADTGSESSTAGTTLTTDASESSSASTTVTTDATESSGSESEGSSGTPDTGSSGSESGGTSATCEAYCVAYETNCSEEGTQYADHDACLDACNAWEPGTVGDTSGNTQECHLYHATAAASDAATHCPHSQEVPEGGCV